MTQKHRRKTSFPTFSHRDGFATMLITISVTALLGIIGLYSILDFQKGLKVSAYEVQAEQAFRCAESAVEIGINCIETSANPSECVATPTELDPSGESQCVYEYFISEITTQIPMRLLNKDQTEVVLLDNTSETLNVSWKTKDTGNVVEVNLYQDVGTDQYEFVRQYAYACHYAGGDYIEANYVDFGDPHCEILGGIELDGGSYNYTLAQITPRYDQSIEVTIDIEGSAPLQGYFVDANGSVMSSVERRLKVAYMLENLARVFNSTVYANEVSN